MPAHVFVPQEGSELCEGAACKAIESFAELQRAAFGGPSIFLMFQPLLVDSITEAVGRGAGRIVVSGSHGGVSSGRYALQASPRLAVFNDAGVGKDGAGIAALALLQAAGIAACTVAHASARIGEARSTLDEGLISHVNAAAAAMGLRVGVRLREGLAAVG